MWSYVWYPMGDKLKREKEIIALKTEKQLIKHLFRSGLHYCTLIDGSSGIGVHAWSDLDYLICSR